MSIKTEIANELFNINERHHNCCQSVFMPFCKESDMDAEIAYNLCSNFGGGMRVGAVCGAVSGAIMAMGLLECPKEEIENFMANFTKKHGTLNCSELLDQVKPSRKTKPFCTDLVRECVSAVEEAMVCSKK